MKTPDPRTTFLESLLRDDPAESLDNFKEYRVMLNSKLETAERRFRTRRRATIGIWVIIATLVFLGVVVAAVGGNTGRPIGMSFIMVAYFLGYLGVLRLLMYVFVDRYRRESVRDEVRDATLLELSRRVELLSQAVTPKAVPAR